MPYLGELAALGAAASWTVCTLAFAAAGRRVGAFAVNHLRIAMGAVILLAVHWLVHGSFWPAGLETDRLVLLALSAIVGLTLGDLCYFHAFAVLGPRIGSLLTATWPVFAAALAFLMRGESVASLTGAGILLTTGGVLLVLLGRSDAASWNVASSPAQRRVAVFAGLLGSVGQALGAVWAKEAMAAGPGLPDGVDRLSATTVRMVVAMISVLVLAAAAGRLRSSFGAVRDRRALGATLVGTVFGPTLGVWLSLVALHHASTGGAAVLMATAPILMLPVAWFAYGARPGVVGAFGTLVAVAGVFLILGEPST